MPGLHKDGLYLVYTGHSMTPLLRDSDLLSVKPCTVDSIKKGDVIVFQPPDKSIHIVHRVLSINENRIHTRGDSNLQRDPYDLEAKDVIGKIEFAWRGSRRINIRGGRFGGVKSSLFSIRYLRKLSSLIRSWLRPVYQALAESEIFMRITPIRIKPRIFVYKSALGDEHHLLLGKKLIGRRLPDGDWQITPPYRLIIDKSSLN